MIQCGFVLETLRYCEDLEEKIRLNGCYEHIGYVNKVFKTKKQAAAYYNTYHPHMRALEMQGGWLSDYDPDTKLCYAVRENYGQCLKLPSLTHE